MTIFDCARDGPNRKCAGTCRRTGAAPQRTMTAAHAAIARRIRTNKAISGADAGADAYLTRPPRASLASSVTICDALSLPIDASLIRRTAIGGCERFQLGEIHRRLDRLERRWRLSVVEAIR